MSDFHKTPTYRRTRFAPTPSGFLHKGNAFSFVLTWLNAKQYGANVLLRIDDLDSSRKRPEYVEDVFRSLDWLGLSYDEGPTGPDDFEANYSQRHRLDLYAKGLDTLRKAGTVFACACTRATVQQAPLQKHPPSCREEGLSLDEPNLAWRIITADTPIAWTDIDGSERSVNLHDEMREFIVRRKDSLPAYQIASVMDDSHFDVDLVVRGEDLIPSTAAQLWVAQGLDLPFRRTAFVHHPLLFHEDGGKLSKSVGDTSLAAMRSSHASAAELFKELSPMLGLKEPVESAEQAFDAWMDAKC